MGSLKGKPRVLIVSLVIMVITAMLLLPFVGSIHLFDTDEVNYAESAREMLLTGDYMNVQIDYEPFPEKPPLFFWLQALSMKLLGVNEFAARFPNVICGILTMLSLYLIGRRIYGHRFGLFWVLSYGSAILPFFFLRTGIIDPWFNLFIFTGMSTFVFYLVPEEVKNRRLLLFLSALLFGLAVLTKGPVALAYLLICFLLFLLLRRHQIRTSKVDVLIFILITSVVGGSWYLHQLFSGNGYVLKDFVQYHFLILKEQKSGHGGFPGYHLLVLLLGVFPASVLALKSITKKSEQTDLQRVFKQWMYILILVVIVLYSIARTKLLHYSSLAYFPLTFLSAWVWEKWKDRKIEIGRWQIGLMLIIAMLFSALAILLPLLTDNHQWLLNRNWAFLNDFTREAIQRDVHWSGYEWLIGVFLIVGVVYSLIRISRRSSHGMLTLHLTVMIFVTSTIYVFTEHLEGYLQRDAIKFYKGLRGQDVYVRSMGFQSYSHLFYFEKPPGEPTPSVEELMNNELDKDAYFVIRIDEKAHYLECYPELEVILEKDGFVFALKHARTH